MKTRAAVSLETRHRMSLSRSGNKHWNWKGGLCVDKKSYQKKWIQNNKDHVRAYDQLNKLRWNYGVTKEQYLGLLKTQNSCCAICGIPELECKRKLSVDHNHNTGKIRGLLCTKCNSGIGQLNEDISLFNKAIEYLKFHSED